MKDTVREILRRMALGILQPRYCRYTEKHCIIEFGVICQLFKALSEAERAAVALCVYELFQESYFTYDKAWIKEDDEGDDGVVVSYSWPPQLVVRLE